MRAPLLLALVSLTALADDYPGRFHRFCDRTAQGRTSRGLQCDDLAFFEFAPASGAGMPAACSTTAPTGAKGEALTFTRASNGTCTKTSSGGLATTGIANGDLVVLSSNQPRVSYDANGTRGLLVESARTNSLLRSEEIDNAAWQTAAVGVANPTVTANAATAPDGTLTADRVQVPACGTASQYSVVLQNLSVASPTGSLYVRGVGGAGSFTLYVRDGAAAASVVCSYVSTSWARCAIPFTTAASTQYGFGCLNTVAPIGGTDTGAADFYAWGAQVEAGAYATSYIPTVAAGVTRSAESPSFGPATFGIATNRASVAASVQRTTGTAQAVPWLLQNVYEFIYTGTTSNYHYPAASFFGTLAMPASGVVRLATGADGVTRTNCVNGTCESTSVVSTNFIGSPWTLVIGSEAGAKYIDSIISRICVDPDPNRCR